MSESRMNFLSAVAFLVVVLGMVILLTTECW